MDEKCLILNFKAYNESCGLHGEKLAHTAQKVALDLGAKIIICPPLASAFLARELEIPVFAQHADAVEPGAKTGHITVESLAAAGLKGTLLNHSERRIPPAQVSWAVERARKIGFETCVCAKDAEEAKALAGFKPVALAVEPPELIGSGISVSTAKPEVVTESVKVIRAVSPRTLALVGAGVSNAHDAKKALELGADGVLLASAFVKAKDPEAWLRGVAKAMVEFGD